MTIVRNNFKGYILNFNSAAKRDLKKLNPMIAKEIVDKLEDLVAGKPNIRIEKMETTDNKTYRLRYGRFRAIFEVYKDIITVEVVKVGPRKDVYRKY